MNTTHSTRKKLLAQALGIAAAAVLGVLANGGTAAADGHEVGDPNATWPCAVGPCSSSGSAWGAPDGAEVLDTSWVPAVEADDLSADSPHDNFWTHDNWSTHNNLPVASYPAPPSWPDNGWGVDDRG